MNGRDEEASERQAHSARRRHRACREAGSCSQPRVTTRRSRTSRATMSWPGKSDAVRPASRVLDRARADDDARRALRRAAARSRRRRAPRRRPAPSRPGSASTSAISCSLEPRPVAASRSTRCRRRNPSRAQLRATSMRIVEADALFIVRAAHELHAGAVAQVERRDGDHAVLRPAPAGTRTPARELFSG